MKKIISVLSAVFIFLSVLIVPVFAENTLTPEEIEKIYRTMGISTWGSGYFGCDMGNPEGAPAPDGVIHQYIQSAGLLEDFEYEREVTAEWGTYVDFGYELPYTKYIEIVDSVFANHSDMKEYLNGDDNEYYNSDYYDEETGIVSWSSGGFGGPTDWLVQEIYRSSDSLVYVTGVMVEYAYEDEYFADKKENFEYITVNDDAVTYKAEINEPILLTLTKEDGKWKILEYREHSYHIVDDKLYNLLEGTVFNRLTIEKTGASVFEDENSKDFTTGFLGNGSRWFEDGQEITFLINEKAGYELKGVTLEDDNGKIELVGKDGAYTIAPAGTAVLTVNTVRNPVDIEISNPEDKSEIKVSETQTEIFAVVNKTVEELNSAISEETEILKADGTKAEDTDKIASGMQLVIKNDDGEVIDTKTVVVPGDVNGDAEISAADARSALRASVTLDELNDWATAAADIDGGKKIEAADARGILRASVGLDNSKDWISRLV